MKKSFYAIIAILLLAVLVLGVVCYRNNESISSLRQEKETLSKTVSDKGEEITALNEDIKSKGTEIGKLTADAAELSAQVEALTKAGGEKDTEIGKLTADAAELSAQVEALTKAVEEKDAEIGKLTADAAELSAQVGALTKAVEEKDTEIGKLTGMLADANAARETMTMAPSSAEDLSAVSEGTFNTTKRFIAALKAHNINYSTKNAADESEADRVYVTFTSNSVNGVAYEYTVTALFRSNSNEMEFKVWNLIDYNAADTNAVIKTCDEMNQKYKWVRFYTDPSDNSVTADLYLECADIDGIGNILFEGMADLTSVLDGAYDAFVPYKK